jgi:hypothetical protein
MVLCGIPIIYRGVKFKASEALNGRRREATSGGSADRSSERREGRTTDSHKASTRFPSCALKAACGLQAVVASAKMGVIDLLSPASEN